MIPTEIAALAKAISRRDGRGDDYDKEDVAHAYAIAETLKDDGFALTKVQP